MDRYQPTETETYTGLLHAGAGTGLALGQLSVIIPGLLPTVALTAVFTVAVLLPIVALGLLAALVIGPPYALWRLAGRSMRARNAVT
jgi:hypothetical protein